MGRIPHMGRILSTVDRRHFLRATGGAAALSLSGRLGLARTLPEVGALHRLIEETPRERVAAELAALIRDGLDHHRILTALAVATSRRVQPFHKAIAVQNVHRLAPIVGPEYAPPVLRSLAAALQNHGYDPNPATRDLPSDRTWREFQTRLGEIPKTWKQGRRDDAARNELVRTLREVSELDAGRAVIDLLKHGVSTDSIWEGLFATAAEVVLRRPAVVPVHAQTSANAFHYVLRHARAETTQLLALLQSAAFMPAFLRGVRGSRPDLRVDELEPLAVSGDGGEALRDAFSELPHDRTSGARKALHYLQRGGSAATFITNARRHLARNGRRAHDYKFTEAALENHGEMAPGAWRDRILSASHAGEGSQVRQTRQGPMGARLPGAASGGRQQHRDFGACPEHGVGEHHRVGDENLIR